MSNVTGKVGLNLGNSGSRTAGNLLQIIQIPNNLPQSARALRLDGQITQVNTQQNSVQIQTPEGDIEVRANTQNIRTGDRVSVEVPPGRLPRGVRVIVEPTAQQSPKQNNPTGTRIDSRAQPVILTPPKIDINRNAVPPAPNQSNRTEGQQIQPVNQAVTRAENALQASRPPPIIENLPQRIAQLTTAVTEEIATQIARVLVQAPEIIRPDTIVRILSTTPTQAQTIIESTLRALPPAQLTQLQNIIQNFLNPTQSNQGILQTNNVLPTPLPPQPVTALNNLLGQTTPSTPQVIVQNPTPNTTLLNPPSNAASNLLLHPTSTHLITPAQQFPPQQIISALQQITGTSAPNPPANTAQTATPQVATIQPVLFDPAAPQAIQTINAPKLQIQIISINPPIATIEAVGNTITPQVSTPSAQPIIAASQASILPAQIVGFTPRGLPLLSLQLPGASTPQYFIAQIKGENLQLGTQLQILQRGAIAPATPVPSIQTNPLLRSFQWPALDELNLLLQQTNPQAAASVSRTLPSANNPTQLTAAAMTFIAAVKSGDLASLLGNQKIDLIRQAGRENILSRLTLGDGARAGVEAVSSSDWRAVPLPMFWEGEIHQITLYTRQENFDQQNDQDENKGHTRFIFDLSLSKMGDVQLDGFLKDDRLDLILRSQQSFSEPMQQTMRQAYSGALEKTELSGELNFQGSLDQWVKVDEEKAAYMAQI